MIKNGIMVVAPVRMERSRYVYFNLAEAPTPRSNQLRISNPAPGRQPELCTSAAAANVRTFAFKSLEGANGKVDLNKKKILELAKGFRGRSKNCIRIAKDRVRRALQNSYKDRRNKKRDMRSLWIDRINAGARLHGVNYGSFMHGLLKENILLNRKVLSELSILGPNSFKSLVDVSRAAGDRPLPKKDVGSGVSVDA